MSLNMVTVTLEPRGTDVSKDRAVNSWHVGTVDDEPATRTAVVTAFENFYQTIRDWLSPSLVAANTPVHKVRMYVRDVGDPDSELPEGESDDSLGSPVAINTFGLESTGAVPMAPQVCVRIGLNAPLTGIQVELPDGTRPQRQRMGGPFIGPLAAVCGEADANGYLRVKATFRSALETAVLALQDELDGFGALQIYSPTSAQYLNIVRGRVDDSFDVIRSRKIKKLGETVFTIPVPG